MSEHESVQSPSNEQLAGMHLSPWLGRSAVRVEDARVKYALSCPVDEHGEFTDPEDRIALERGLSRVQDLTSEARSTLAEANSLHHGVIAASMHLRDMPEALQNMLFGNKVLPDMWQTRVINALPVSRNWLTNRLLMYRLIARNSDDSFVVPNDTVLNVLQWHNHHMAQGQPAFEQAILPHRQNFIEQTYKAAALGWLLPATVKIWTGWNIRAYTPATARIRMTGIGSAACA